LDRLPYRATQQAAAYEHIVKLPVSVLLDNVRSAYNVGAFFRAADGAGIARLHLCGITGHPPANAITKTALGAEESVAWDHTWDAVALANDLRSQGHELAAIETTPQSVDIFGLRPELASLADTHIRIPMLGLKHSLNVATAGGIVMYELLRKYRMLSA
jgi:tRNA G18 (ribose-2'-O)-methylase SpoU